MERLIDRLARIPLHPDARNRIVEKTKEHAELLTAQATVLAQGNGDDTVSVRHVEEAAAILRPGKNRKRLREVFLNLIGAGLFGIGAENFISEMSHADGPRASYTVAFTVMIVVGLLTSVAIAFKSE